MGEEFADEVTDITFGGDYAGLSAFATGIETPYGLAQDALGTIYVSEIVAGEITDITLGGDYSDAIPFAFGLDVIDEIAIDLDGRIFAVQEFLGSIIDVSAGGDFSGADPFAFGLDFFPQQIAVAPVPEPGPACSILLGICFLSQLRRRLHAS